MNLKLIKISFALIFFTFGCASSPESRRCEATSRAMSSNQDITVSVSYYGDPQPTSKSILIMPPTGGTNYIDRRYATDLCRAGFDVYILDSWSNMEFETIQLDRHQKFYMRAQLAVSEVLKAVPAGFVGMLGTSLGGLHTSISIQTQPRVQAAFLIVAGTPIIDTVMESDQEAMIALRKVRRDQLGYKTDSELHEALRQAFTLEPQKLGSSYKDKIIGMSIATEDTTVPTSRQIELKNFYQPQTVITHESSHFWGIVKTWLFETSDIVSFFKKAAETKNTQALQSTER